MKEKQKLQYRTKAVTKDIYKYTTMFWEEKLIKGRMVLGTP